MKYFQVPVCFSSKKRGWKRNTVLGQDEYNLIDLVKYLGDFDPFELTGNFAESSDSRDSCSSAEYQDERSIVKVKGNLKLNVAFFGAYRCFSLYSRYHFRRV